MGGIRWGGKGWGGKGWGGKGWGGKGEGGTGAGVNGGLNKREGVRGQGKERGRGGLRGGGLRSGGFSRFAPTLPSSALAACSAWEVQGGRI